VVDPGQDVEVTVPREFGEVKALRNVLTGENTLPIAETNQGSTFVVGGNAAFELE
jgi:hypothetical protein